MGINVYKFDDYRKLLEALIEDRRQQKKVFSYRWFSQKAGLTSPNFLNLVVKGKRHLSSESVEKVIEIFGFAKAEAEFFRILVQFNKSKTLSEKEHFALALVKLKKFQNEHPFSKDQFEFYSRWFNIPIKELFNLKDPPNSPEEFSARLIPGISATEAESSLAQLETLGLIEKVKGRYRSKTESLTTGNKFSSFGVVQYHKKMLQLATESLDRFPGAEREISSVTIGMSEDSFHRIKKMIEDFRSELMQIAEDDRNKEQVFQINFQMFPLSTKKDRPS